MGLEGSGLEAPRPALSCGPVEALDQGEAKRRHSLINLSLTIRVQPADGGD